MPLDAFLAEGEATRTEAGSLQNEDMIVDSALLPKRHERRGDLQARSFETIDYPITPRRPFSTPMWQSAGSPPPTATANLPASVSPTEPTNVEPISVATAMPAPMEVSFESPAAISEGPSSAALDKPATENPFTALTVPTAEPIETTPEPRQPILAAGPLFAPGPVAALPAVAPAESGPALAAVTTPPARLVEPAVQARPVDLTAANRLEQQSVVREGLKLNTPLLVGLALAAVAIGTVMVRRRFA